MRSARTMSHDDITRSHEDSTRSHDDSTIELSFRDRLAYIPYKPRCTMPPLLTGLNNSWSESSACENILYPDDCGGFGQRNNGGVEVIILTDSESDYQSPDDGQAIARDVPTTSSRQSSLYRKRQLMDKLESSIIDVPCLARGPDGTSRRNIEGTTLIENASTASQVLDNSKIGIALNTTDDVKSNTAEKNSEMKSWNTIEVVTGSESELEDGSSSSNGPALSVQKTRRSTVQEDSPSCLVRKTSNHKSSETTTSSNMDPNLLSTGKSDNPVNAHTCNIQYVSQKTSFHRKSTSRSYGAVSVSEKDDQTFYEKMKREKQMLETNKRIFPLIMKVVGDILDVEPEKLLDATKPETEYASCVRESFYEDKSGILLSDDWDLWTPLASAPETEQSRAYTDPTISTSKTSIDIRKHRIPPSSNSNTSSQWQRPISPAAESKAEQYLTNRRYEGNRKQKPRSNKYYQTAFISDIETSQSLKREQKRGCGKSRTEVSDVSASTGQASQKDKSHIPRPHNNRRTALDSSTPPSNYHPYIDSHIRRNNNAPDQTSQRKNETFTYQSQKGTFTHSAVPITLSREKEKYESHPYHRRSSTKETQSSIRNEDKMNSQTGRKQNQEAHKAPYSATTETASKPVTGAEGLGFDTENHHSLERQLHESKRIIERLTEQMRWMENHSAGRQDGGQRSDHGGQRSDHGGQRSDHGWQSSNQKGNQGDTKFMRQIDTVKIQTTSPSNREKHRKPGSPMRKRSPQQTPVTNSEKSFLGASPRFSVEKESNYKFKTHSVSADPKQPKPTRRMRINGSQNKRTATPRVRPHEDSDSDCNAETNTLSRTKSHQTSTPLEFRDVPSQTSVSDHRTRFDTPKIFNQHTEAERRQRKDMHDPKRVPSNSDGKKHDWAKFNKKSSASLLKKHDSENSDSDSFSLYIRVHRKNNDKPKHSLKKDISTAVSDVIRKTERKILPRESNNVQLDHQQSTDAFSVSTQTEKRRESSPKYVQTYPNTEISQTTTCDNTKSLTGDGICIQTQTVSPTNGLHTTQSTDQLTQTDMLTSNSTTEDTTVTDQTWMLSEKPFTTIRSLAPTHMRAAPKQAQKDPVVQTEEKITGNTVKNLSYRTGPCGPVERSTAPSVLFDSNQFDSILDQIFPAKDSHLVWEPNTSHLSKPDSHTPEELLKITKPPGIAYVDQEQVIRYTTSLYDELTSRSDTDSILPLQIPYLPSYDFVYATNQKGHHVELGWSGGSRVYLGMNRGNRQYVAIKLKPRSVVIQEARMLMYLREVSNIPRFYGLLAMTDGDLLGLVCELVADDGKDRETRSKDIGAMLSLERGRSAKDSQYLTPYQWLDICIAICKIILDIHEHGAIVNDLSIYNVLIRLDGRGWVPYIVDLSSCQLSMSSTAAHYEGWDEERLSKYHRHVAPEILRGEIRTEASDVFSLAYLIGYMQREVRINVNPIIEQGLLFDAGKRPTARCIMNHLIHQRSHYD